MKRVRLCGYDSRVCLRVIAVNQVVVGAMGLKIIRIIGLVVITMTSLLSLASPASAAAPTWIAVPIPGSEGYQLGPPGVDIRDLAVADDVAAIYAVPGDSISDRSVYKSVDAGASWEAQHVFITADLVAVAPDNVDVAAVARRIVPWVYFTTDGGATWRSLGAVEGGDGSTADEIHDIAISAAEDGVHYLAVAGEEVDGEGNVWYCQINGEKPEWQETSSLPGFASVRSVRASAFSPSFTKDGALVTIGEDEYGHVKLHAFSFTAQAWNVPAGFESYPVSLLEYDVSDRVASASIVLAPEYAGNKADTRLAFIGLTISGDTAASGLYRIRNTAIEQISNGISINSLDFDGQVLVAGAFDASTVYSCRNPQSRTPTVRPNSAMKGPGGKGRVAIALAGNVVVVGTSGNESAFAISTNSGLAFNDISLIDTKLENLSDVAVSENGETVYLASDDGDDLSLWRRTSSWQRVLSQKGTSGYIVRLAPGEADSIYLAEKGGDEIYYSPDGGEKGWSAGKCLLDVQDLAVESSDVAYVLDAEGKMTRTRSAGLSWDLAIDTGLDEDTGYTIVSADTDVLLAGSDNGYVAYSLDGGSSWKKISWRIQNGAGRVQVVPDENFASNKIIYAASDRGGQNVMRWRLGSSSSWTDIYKGTLSGGIYGLAVEDNVLYALEYNPGQKQSRLWQCLLPDEAYHSSNSWESRATAADTDISDPEVAFNASPQAVKLSSGGSLWALKTNGTNRLYRLDDAMTRLVLQAPDDGYVNPVNPVTGIADDITCRWQRALEATEYEFAIAQDEEFKALVASITVASDSSPVVISVGPAAEGLERVNFSMGTTYYWKVRITQPLFRISSEPRVFHIESLEVGPPVIIERPPPPVITIPTPPEQTVPFPPITIPPSPPPPEIVFEPAPSPSPAMPGYMWAIIAAGVAVLLTVMAYVLMSFMDRFLIFWLQHGRYRWSRWRRKKFETGYLEQPLPVAASLEQIEALLKQVTWTMDGPFHLFDAISYPQTVWAKKKDDCDGFAVLAAALLRQWQPESRPVLLTAMLRPMRKSHTVCAFSVPGAGLWFFDNYSLCRGHYRTYADIAVAVRGKARLVCWDVVEPDTLQTLEFRVASSMIRWM